MKTYEPYNQTRADEIIAGFVGMDGAMLPILHALQEAFGYVPREALPRIAEALNLTRAEVYGVTTFYHDFREAPPGRHVVKLCRAEACQSMGGDAIAERMKRRLGVGFGETRSDGQVTLDEIFCLGLCAVAPSALVDGRLIGRLDEETADAIAAEVG
jgi:formate dehydrogenase subunit gamma